MLSSNETFSFKETLPTSLKEKDENDEEENPEMKSNEENGGQSEEPLRMDDLNKSGASANTQETDEITFFQKQAEFMLNLAIEANEKGDFFPVWGTCLGFQ